MCCFCADRVCTLMHPPWRIFGIASYLCLAGTDKTGYTESVLSEKLCRDHPDCGDRGDAASCEIIWRLQKRKA